MFNVKKIGTICILALLLYTIYIVIKKDKNTVMKPIEETEFEIPLTEDLMREHGLLNRLLLVYEDLLKKIDTDNHTFPIHTLKQTVLILKTFIEEYHEKLEEDHIFPLFEKHSIEVTLVQILKEQHIQGRKITAQLQDIVNKKTSLAPENKKTIASLLQQFIDMYRPHEAREDTELFPLVRSLLSEEEFKELSETFEHMEHAHFGEHGFEKMVERVATIEKSLGIYQLDQFTPKQPKK